MTLVPLYQWEVDPKTGRPVLDKDGRKIPHKRAGRRKDAKDLTPQEKDDIETQERLYRTSQRARAAAVLGAIEDAKETLGDT